MMLMEIDDMKDVNKEVYYKHSKGVDMDMLKILVECYERIRMLEGTLNSARGAMYEMSDEIAKLSKNKK